MQVTHQQDHVTHAVISGNETIAFGITASPEFLQVLSKSLYTNPNLAVVREVLCNAWDAHIEAGLQDRPIEITLEHNKLEIRDFGFGIPKDMIGPIYGTYGNSTKKHDGNQTGGFGLGCKAPFAYTDHFEVESFHQGTRTIYAMSKSSAERNGLPGITPIVDLPTAESGLRVTIQIRPQDMYIFEGLIKEVIWNGEIKALLNGVKLPVLELSKAPEKWIITKTDHFSRNTKIHVRYGNVIYPVPTDKVYAAEYNRILGILGKLGRYDAYNLLLQAPPHSISVSPNREALSLQEHTIATLKNLLSDFLKSADKSLITDAEVILQELLRQRTKQKEYYHLFDRYGTIPGYPSSNPQPMIQTPRELAHGLLIREYPENQTFRRKDLAYRLKLAMRHKVGNKQHQKALRQIIKNEGLALGSYAGQRWFLKEVVTPLTKALEADPVMDPSLLYIFDNASNSRADRNSYGLVEIKKYKPGMLNAYVPLTRNILVLTHSQADLEHKIRQFPEMNKLGHAHGVYVYRAPYAKTKVQAMRDFFLKRKFTLLDLTVPQPWDEKKPKRVVTPKTITPRREGFPALSGCRNSNNHLRVDYCFEQNAPTITDPKYYLRVDYSRAHHRDFRLAHYESKEAKHVLDLYGDKCAVVRTLPAEMKLKDAGVLELGDAILKEISDEFLNSPQFKAYWAESYEIASGYFSSNSNPHHDSSIQEVFHIPIVRKLLGLKVQLSEQDQKKLRIWQWSNWLEHTSDLSVLSPVRDMFRDTKLSTTMGSIQKNIEQNNILLDLLNKKGFGNVSLISDPKVLARVATLMKAVFIG